MKKEDQLHRYYKNQDIREDQEFEQADCYGKVKLGSSLIFWKKGFVWYKVKTEDVERAYRRIEEVNAKMCCGRFNLDTQKLMLVKKDQTVLELLIGDRLEKEATALYEAMKQKWPQLSYGKKAEA